METLGIIVIVGVLILFVFTAFSESNRRREEMMLGQGMMPMGMNPFDPRSMNKFMEMYYQFKARKQGEAIMITIILSAIGLGVIMLSGDANSQPATVGSHVEVPIEQQPKGAPVHTPRPPNEDSSSYSKASIDIDEEEQDPYKIPNTTEADNKTQLVPSNVPPKSERNDWKARNDKPLEAYNDGTISLNLEWTSYIQLLSGQNESDIQAFAERWSKKLDKPLWTLEENGAWKVLVGAFPNPDAAKKFIRYNRLPHGAFYKDCSGLSPKKVRHDR
jgi:hypothetical protein